MHSNVLVRDYASLAEAELMNSKVTGNMLTADVIVNPTQGSHIQKIIIINLPLDIPISKLQQFNKIISRFPIGYGIEVEPYNMPEVRKDVKSEDYSCLLLDKELLTNMDYIQAVRDGNFILGNDELVDDEMSLIGYLILRSNIENL